MLSIPVILSINIINLKLAILCEALLFMVLVYLLCLNLLHLVLLLQLFPRMYPSL